MSTTRLAHIAEVRQKLKSGEAREARLAAGMSLAEVAKAADVSTTAVFRYENGERTPRPAQAVSLWRVLRKLERVRS